jgi:hypothetical protein
VCGAQAVQQSGAPLAHVPVRGMGVIEYGGVKAVAKNQDLPCTLDLTGAAAVEVLKWMRSHNANEACGNTGVFCLWAALDDLYPADE